MASFIYNVCEHAPKVTTAFGVEFVMGEASVVTDPYAIQQLSRNPSFTLVDGATPDREVDFDKRATVLDPSFARRAAEHEALQMILRDGSVRGDGRLSRGTAVEAHGHVQQARGEKGQPPRSANPVLPESMFSPEPQEDDDDGDRDGDQDSEQSSVPIVAGMPLANSLQKRAHRRARTV